VFVEVNPNFILCNQHLDNFHAMILQRLHKVLVGKHQNVDGIFKSDWINKLSQVQKAVEKMDELVGKKNSFFTPRSG